MCVCVCVFSHSVVSNFLWPHGLKSARLLCPWDSPSKNTGVGSHSLLQWIFPIHGLNSGLLHCRQILYHLSQQGSLYIICIHILFSCSVVSNSLRPHGLQHARLPCPSPSPKVCSNSCPLSWWCHPTISSSVIPFSCLQSFPASGSFPMSWLFTSGGQSFGASASASVLPVNIQDWYPSEWTGWISLQSKGLSRVLSSTTIQNSALRLI